LSWWPSDWPTVNCQLIAVITWCISSREFKNNETARKSEFFKFWNDIFSVYTKKGIIIIIVTDHVAPIYIWLLIHFCERALLNV
jgi:hypothetical protein